MSGARHGRPLDRLVRPLDRDAASLYAFNTALIRVCQPGPCARNHPSTSGSTRREMDSLAAGGLSPRLTMARTMCAASASGWPRSILMSRSRWAATLGQSVRDALEVDFALTLRRLSHGDDVNVVALFGVDNGDDDLAEKPQRDEPSFPIREPVVFVRVGHALEHLLRIGEVESVLLEVPSSLRLIPRDHLWSVSTSCIRVKGWRSGGPTRAIATIRPGTSTIDRGHSGRRGLVLLDLMMPEMDGFEFLEELRRDEAGRAIPVIVVTAGDLSAEDRRWLNGQVERILEKGAYSREALLAEVRALVAASVGRGRAKELT